MTQAAARLSVVVPTYNRSDRITRLLRALAEQDGAAPFDVVVVDDASTDDTVAVLERLQDGEDDTTLPYELTVLTSPSNRGAAAARNRGWRHTNTERIVFIDDDCVPDPGWLSAIATALADADIAVGRTRPPEDQLHLVGPFSAYLDIGHDLSFSTCNIAYRRDVLEKMDGFDDVHFGGANGEDTDLGLRATKAGFNAGFVAAALVWHDVSPSDFGAHLRRLRQMQWLPALVALHPEARANLNVGWFLRSVDKAVLICWVALLALLARPRRADVRLLALVAAGLYVWQFGRSHYRARSAGEWVTSVPLGFVADSYAVFVLLRGSVKNRTVLL
jgi:glycosyltransferase involved in cell wall biosynthesis